jgi:hypothetical protein
MLLEVRESTFAVQSGVRPPLRPFITPSHLINIRGGVGAGSWKGKSKE